MKRLTILLVSSLFVLIQSVSYCQHIPFGITRSELLERVRTMGGALRLAPHEGQIDTLKDVISVDSIEMFGWKGNIDFLEGKNGKICMYGLTIRNASLSDFHKVSIAFAHEFHLNLVKRKKFESDYGRFWDHIENNKLLTYATIFFFPSMRTIVVRYMDSNYM